MNKDALGLGGGQTKQKLRLNQIKANGESGKFIYTKILEGKNAEGVYETIEIPQSALEGVIVASRRKLDDYALGLSTPEFLKNDEVVPLYGSEGKERGTVDDLRKAHEGLRTTVVVYFYLINRKEMVRLMVKGLGMQDETSKAVNYKGWFQYIFSFLDPASPTDVVTKVFPIQKEMDGKGKSKLKKTFYALRFEEGEAISPELKETITELQEQVVGKAEEKSTIDEVVNDLKYPDDENTTSKGVDGEVINVEDIPF